MGQHIINLLIPIYLVCCQVFEFSRPYNLDEHFQNFADINFVVSCFGASKSYQKLTKTCFWGDAGPHSAISRAPDLQVLGSIPSLATYFSFSFRCFKKGSCQLLVKVCARSTG